MTQNNRRLGRPWHLACQRLQGSAVLLMLLSVSGVLTGCGYSDERSAGAAGGNALSDEGHEHHHHHRPSHKPESFQELPTELRWRLSADDSGRVSPSRRRLRQLQDIVGWIPELAADSELRRAGFEQAVAQQLVLQQVLDALTAGGSADMAAWNSAVASLQELADSVAQGVADEGRSGSGA